MGWFRKKPSGAGDHAAESTEVPSADDLDGSDAVVESIITTALDAGQHAQVEERLRQAITLGADPEDIASIGHTLDRLRSLPDDTVSRADLDAVATALGEHLARHGGFRWAFITAPFGSDVGLESRRGTTTVVPSNLVAARWMRRETGWVEGVVRHLARVAASR
jgi:hypothetical protein